MIPVVNYERLERLKPPPPTNIPLNANTACIFIIILAVIGLYKRSVDVSQSRSRRYT
jgi:hypothetical protein